VSGFPFSSVGSHRGRKAQPHGSCVLPQALRDGAFRMPRARAGSSGVERKSGEYLRRSLLRSRLLTIASPVAEQLAGKRVTVLQLMGSSIDGELVSSVTFLPACREAVTRRGRSRRIRLASRCGKDDLARAATLSALSVHIGYLANQ
jgi:hypothetical protein